MRVTGQDNLWPSNMPPWRSCANHGESAICGHGAILTVPVARSGSCGFTGRIKPHQSARCCSSSCLPARRCRSRFIPTTLKRRSIESSPNGKTEAWYILSASPGAQVAVGLKRCLSSEELRASIENGSIADLVQWRPVIRGDFIFVPAGTIHAIGEGIVLAEIQQHSDATFRLFDYGRQRQLHKDNAVAVSDAGPIQVQSGPRRLSPARTLLTASPHFVLERIDLAANTSWALNTDRETWFLVLDGHAAIGLAAASAGEALFIGDDRASIEVGADGFSGLIAYPGPDPIASLLQDLAAHSIKLTGVSLPQFAEIEVRS